MQTGHMKELAGRMEKISPHAGAALRAVAYFDRLMEAKSGLEGVTRGAAVLSGSPAHLIVPGSRLHIRVDSRGVRTEVPEAPSPGWCHASVDGKATLWIERPLSRDPLIAVILERAVITVRSALERSSANQLTETADHDPFDVVLCAQAPEATRLAAAEHLGLGRDSLAHVVATPDGLLDVVPATCPRTPRGAAIGRSRFGLGPPASPEKLPDTIAAAKTAALFTAEGDDTDPGPRIVHYNNLGVLALLVVAADPKTQDCGDVEAIERVAALRPGMLRTLDALARCETLRGAALQLHVHHSTLQSRRHQAETLLGWELSGIEGRLRLAAAMMVRRILVTRHHHNDQAHNPR